MNTDRSRGTSRTALAAGLLAALATTAAGSTDSASPGQASAVARRIDTLLADHHKKHQVKPNPLAGHDVFLRRAYLSIVGRIPTYAEATAFLKSSNKKKRSQLIDQLLASDGYVSHNFNYWADLLRVKSRLNRVSGQPYIDWVQQALRENRPYDRMVRELITASGHVWANGAAGYYQRDFAMPLDNMSNTIQVFMGTRLGCAQCHDHPFDLWTQLDYYGMAAYTYDVRTQRRRRDLPASLRQFVRALRSEDQQTRQMGRRLIDPVRFEVYEQTRPLQLPEDYKYDDARPGSVVGPKVVFGRIEAADGETTREAYAHWLTSSDNPRFTLVIANRLWKKVFGVGLIEPVDNVQNGYGDATSPELLKYLAEQMVAMNYDLKQFLRALYHTKLFQRRVSRTAWNPAEPYRFPGPILRRMTAEQVWDSMLTLAIDDLDQRRATGFTRARRAAPVPPDEIAGKSTEQLLAIARQMAAQRNDRRSVQQVRRQINDARKAGDQTRVKALRQQQRQMLSKMSERRMSEDGAVMTRSQVRQDTRWQGFHANMVRASQLPSPAPPGHFLRRFGQSDREIIENASDEATVPQILNMINGPLFSRLMKTDSVLVREVKARKSRTEKIEVIFLSIYGRKPTPSEIRIATTEIKSQGGDGYENVVWALLNTRQFLFLQ